jgi:diaminopimelate decarboxylase
MELTQGLNRGIGQFNIESEEEGIALATIAHAQGIVAPAVLRVNPDIDAKTHAKISTGKAENKFGVPIADAPAIFARLASMPGLNLRGIALHIGSMIADLAPLEAAFLRIGALVATLRAAGHIITHVDLGGGLGAPYRPTDIFPDPATYGAMVARVTRSWDVALAFEPGRVIVANAGVLLTRIIRVKPGATCPFIVVDAAMNDLTRPAMYDAYHHFEPVKPSGATHIANIVGPVCESSDTFAVARDCGVVTAGDLAIFRSAGAYGATMASTYNSRDLVPEVLVSGNRFAVVADRISAATIMHAERVPDWL